ncbi:MAG: SRPBCC family protein [Pseudomonadota bacterium]
MASTTAHTRKNPTAHTRKNLENLKRLAAKPLDRATAMEPAMYTDEGILDLEYQNIFRKGWLCAGRAESIPTQGDYLTYEIADQPVVIIRQKDGSIKAFANVCRHRMMRLLEGRGRARRIMCPYHAWTYHMDGRLIGAPHMQETKCFERSKFNLFEVKCETWLGWIYVTLNKRPRSLKRQLAELTEVVAPYQMENYVEVAMEDHVWNTNWKQLTENFMEGYHLPVAHAATVGGFFPVEDTRFSEKKPNPAFTYQTFSKTEDAPVGTAHPDNKHLKGDARHTSVLPTIFPSHMMTLAPDHLWYLSLHPKGIDQVRIRYGIAFAPEVLEATKDKEALIRETKDFLDRVNEEDRFVTEGIWQGAVAPLSEPGPLSWLERENHEFTQYISRMLNRS